MTDQNIPADKFQEVIDFLAKHAEPDLSGEYEIGYSNAIWYCLGMFGDLLPKPRTLADELRNLAADYDENGYPEPESDLSEIADRVEALENELKSRDETPALPGGWRLADHPDHERVIVTKSTPDHYGYVYSVIPSETPLGYDWHCCEPAELTYLDTAQEKNND